MADDPTLAVGAGNIEDEDAWAAITADERILETKPDARSALERLSSAYERIGDHTRAKERLLRLCEVSLAGADFASAARLLERLRPYAEDDPTVAGMIERIRTSAPTAPSSTATHAASARDTAKDEASTDFNMAEELAFAWSLLEAGEFTQEEYASIVQDLTEMSGNERGGTISTLHVLEARGHKNLDRVVSYAAKTHGTPFVALSSFDLNSRAVGLLPRAMIVRRGALAFDLLGNDVLVAMLNPANAALKQDIEKATGRRCHFFVTLASEFDRAVEKTTGAPPEKSSPAKS